MKKQDFREEIAPNRDELIVNGENLSATILDAEWDPIKCSFEGDGCVKLDTEELSFIHLTPQNLQILQDLIFEAEIYLKHYEKKVITKVSSANRH